jgi:hypothetical protein
LTPDRSTVGFLAARSANRVANPTEFSTSRFFLPVASPPSEHFQNWQAHYYFQALIDRSRVPLDLETIKTILGYQRRPRYRQRKSKSAQWEVAVEKPTYDLTILKLHCGKLTLKIYTKGERVLRIEVVVHNTAELQCGRSLEKFSQIVVQAKEILERFMNALSCLACAG